MSRKIDPAGLVLQNMWYAEASEWQCIAERQTAMTADDS